MQYYEIHLKDRFPFLGENGRDPVLQVYVQDALHKEMTDMGHRYGARPSVLVCPGGGYHRVSLREAEPIAVHFLPEGFNTFVLTYSTGEEDRFPVQLREVAATMELIHENAAEWCCDPERIAIMGFSAGGHVAFAAGLVGEHKPNAMILNYPAVTMPNMPGVNFMIKLLTGKEDVTDEDAAYVSLLNHVPIRFRINAPRSRATFSSQIYWSAKSRRIFTSPCAIRCIAAVYPFGEPR